ncbi:MULTISPECIES: O-antigen ligase family protein [Psychrilyobacter]|uniref:O-antigen ligase domain-containing protein n=1 Tax=Psychrilyobacter piezotolerans TaxID=2293438 RepID=A0ABX9KDS3_9FUSO|nr:MULTISPECIES: O-antigen ligase family protein [Psychrilyobacter]MCS5422124.1 hypothetical protein [Psychrilyobacter sp. S5]NDI76279.1 hypothetical protein [Psychrilyobacter piezotolerans]RDE59164.1 hypothetical protein DV867_13620 [Psychrilyobacter sp. S5]REI39726.1 hypothetical protein DYH56_13620 [Psychrilyobacter piezotolerans]
MKIKANFFEKVRSIGFLLIIVTLIYNSGYLLITTSKSIGTILMIPTSIILGCMLLKKGFKKKLTIKHIAFFYFIIIYVMTFTINAEFSSYKLYITYLLYIVIAFFLSQVISFSNFINYYLKSVKVITLISLIMFFLINVLGISLNFPLIENVNGRIFYNAWIYFYPLYTGYARNQALFWEPGLFSSILIFAIIFELKFKRVKTSLINIAIFILGLISAHSTAGIILLIPIFVLFLDRKYKKGRNIKSIALGILVIIIFLFCYINYENIILMLISQNEEVFGKLLNDGSRKTSRIGAPLINLIIFSKHPIFGVGFGEATIQFIKLAPNYLVDSQTSTSTFMMAALGIPGFLYTMFWIYGVLILKKTNFLSKITLILIIICILNKEPHQGILISWCILFYLLEGPRKKYSQKIRC